ncbi:aryl-hydrocarbon receptor repressor b [Polypterus senegalus]|uniref:aryl-hydrocarbon receptor repressor b n=1 Tax=Polypterus senegalus TaxID=55291 RepID=UPI00196581FE|nr:aryl-hydrocarbon receptor repressor b [Polypterus senegalus]
MIPPGDCMYAGRKRRKPVQKQKPVAFSEKSNPSKRHRDRLNAELDRLASLLPFSPDIISKLDKLSVLRLSVSYLRVKSFFQAIQDKPSRKQSGCAFSSEVRKDGLSAGGTCLTESDLLLESLAGFALVVSMDGMIFYASSTIADYLGFHQTDVMHQCVFDYIHVDDRQEFQRQLHWSMNPTPQQTSGPEHHLAAGNGEDFVISRLFKAHESDGVPPEFHSFLHRCFVCRVRCLLDSTSGFLTMQFQGQLKFLHGQKKKTAAGVLLPPQLALFCVAVPLLLPEVKMKSLMMRGKPKAPESKSQSGPEVDNRRALGYCYLNFANMMHHSESHRKVATNGHSGQAVVRVVSNEDRWLWLQANAELLCRGSCPEYVLLSHWHPHDKEDEENVVKPLANSHMGDHGTGRLRQQGPWNGTPAMVDTMKSKAQPNKLNGCRFTQDEPLKFCKSPLPGHRPECLENEWPSKCSSGAQNQVGFPNRHHLGKSGGCRAPPSYHHSDPPKYYDTPLNPDLDGCVTEALKMDALYSAQPHRVHADTPVKLEHDLDGRNGCHMYTGAQGRAWECKEYLEKGLELSGPEGVLLKSELDYLEQYADCQKSKSNFTAPLSEHYGDACARNRAARCPPTKDFTQVGSQVPSTHCLDASLCWHHHVEHKEYNWYDDKDVCALRGQHVIHSIKREPMDSPPWHEPQQAGMQTALAHQGATPNCGSYTVPHKPAQYLYLQ